MSRVRFEVTPPIERSEEPLRIVGNHPHLGNWDPMRAPALRWEAPLHVGTIEVEAGTRIEFKVVREDWESEEVDAWGSVPGNSIHEVWLDSTVRRTVADWKDRYSGRLLEDLVRSNILADDRHLLIWLPASYSSEPERRYPVIYFSDGDDVFDPVSSPLSGVDWAADEWVRLLASGGAMPEAMIVGICHPEGFTDGGLSVRDSDLSLEVGGPAFADFLAHELVPYIDSHYRTLGAPGSRVIAGGSLGALNALYNVIEHPDVFERAICLSTAFEDVSEAVPRDSGMLNRLRDRSDLPRDIKAYFDYGTEGLDECYEPYHVDLKSLLVEKGWEEGRQFRLLKVRGGGHSESSWRLRLGDALRWIYEP